MANLFCPVCMQSVPTPDDTAEAHCGHCGQTLTTAETRITASPSAFTSPAIQAAAPREWSPTTSSAGVAAPPVRYNDWDDFQLNSPAVARAWIDLATQALPDMRRAPLQLPAAFAEHKHALGSPIASLTIAGENRWAIHAVSVALVLAGICVPLFTALLLPHRPIVERMSPATRMTIALAWAIGAFAVAYWLSLVRPARWTVTCGIFENGILWQQGGAVEASPWQEIHDLRVYHETGRLTVHLQVRPGQAARFSSDGQPDTMPILEYVVSKVTAARFIADLRRLYQGEALHYGAVTLDRTGLTAVGFRKPWSEIVRVVNDPQHLFVVCRGRADWHPILNRHVSFPQLVMSLANIMIADSGRLPPATA